MLCDGFKVNLACQLKIHERYLPLGKAEYCVAAQDIPRALEGRPYILQ